MVPPAGSGYQGNQHGSGASGPQGSGYVDPANVPVEPPPGFAEAPQAFTPQQGPGGMMGPGWLMGGLNAQQGQGETGHFGQGPQRSFGQSTGQGDEARRPRKARSSSPSGRVSSNGIFNGFSGGTAQQPNNAFMQNMFQQFMGWMSGGKSMGKGFGGMSGAADGKGFSASGFKPEARKVVLDERYFRKLPNFTGLPEKFRGWLFQLMVNVGSVDGELSKELKRLLAEGHDDNLDPDQENNLDEYLYEAYKEELFSVLVQNTSDQAQGVVRALVDRGYGENGFKALNDLAHRYDSRTAAALLHAFLAVVNPTPITMVGEVVSSVG